MHIIISMKDLCLGIQYFAIKLDCYIRVHLLDCPIRVYRHLVIHIFSQILPIKSLCYKV